MDSMDPSLIITDPGEQKWTGVISEILSRQLEIHLEIPPVSIFQVPETITTEKPEAYKPQRKGFGPYHHFRPQPYTKMEQKKPVVVQKVIQDHKIEGFRLTVLDKVQKLVPVVRPCYEMFLQDDNDSMAWVFAIDGLFLLNLFQTYDSDISTKELLAQDIMMVENQIPFMVLKEIYEAFHSSSGTILYIYFTFHVKIFCSPLMEVNEGLHSSSSEEEEEEEEEKDDEDEEITEDNEIPFMWSNFLKNVPQKEVVLLYEKIITSLQKFTRNNITFPSASQLQGKAGFRFHALEKDEGIQLIHVDFSNNFHLPCVTMNNDSEVILRNLVGYETLMPDSNKFPLAEYMGLMCRLVINVDDVKLLRKENIIKGDLGDDEVAKIFIEMSSSIPSLKTKEKSKLQEMIDDVNKVYESRLKIKTYLFLKTLASWLMVVLTAIGSFVGATWKIVAFKISIVTVLMLTYQAYCDVYGCGKTRAM
ncbi:hypothetical protein L1987_32737 [Smallanthus sonchifolius]|uniref:Uncharacterized protein n=1 Tax=Smallanthus sonchifolius TaxID=185202 RepID=A0ACB9HQS7_9ASTR|nr:hypothetical protein L1987_32737 [Smallanthus sonchifolius]